MGFLGVFGDLVLSSLPQGDILEIGCGESSIYLSHLARKFNRHIYHCDIAPAKITNPLTVPGYMRPEALTLQGADQIWTVENSSFFMGESDNLFNELRKKNESAFALTFIDGDHVYEQAKKDFYNAAEMTVDNGYIFLHDTYPIDEFHLQEARCGGVYRLRQEIEKERDMFDCFTFTHGTAMNVGATMVRKKPENRPEYQR